MRNKKRPSITDLYLVQDQVTNNQWTTSTKAMLKVNVASVQVLATSQAAEVKVKNFAICISP